MNEFLFVYGTLMQSRQHKMHQLLAKHAVLQGNGYIQAKLYQISSYPGVIESNHEQDKVYGELYLLRRPRWLLAQLDEYECCSPVFAAPHEYVRKTVDVVLNNHQIQSAWVYVYNYPVKAEQQIKSGRFI